MDRPKRLIVLACTATKRADPDPLIAIRRYDGPSFRTLRKWQATNPTAAELLDIHILSAQLGLIAADTLISNYNQRMTPNRAVELRQSVCTALAHIVAQQGAYTATLIHLGQELLAGAHAGTGSDCAIRCGHIYCGRNWHTLGADQGLAQR